MLLPGYTKLQTTLFDTQLLQRLRKATESKQIKTAGTEQKKPKSLK